MIRIEKNLKTNDIDCKIIFSNRRSISLSVHPDLSVIIRAPAGTSRRRIFRLLDEKQMWIRKHLDNYRKAGYLSPRPEFREGETHLYRGYEYILRITPGGRKYCRFADGIIDLGINGNTSEDAVKKALYSGYRKEAEALFPSKIKEMLARSAGYNFKPSGLRIRTMKRRWGSCSSRGVITLNTELIRFQDKYLEYVILHELCHLEQKNHGAGFYKLLSELCPDWKVLRKELKKIVLG